MKIGELSKRINVSIDTIRYYEQRQLLPLPKRTKSGYRDYSESDVKQFQFVIHAKDLGFTLEEIRELLSLKAGKVACSQVQSIAERKANEVGLKIEQLLRIQSVLIELAEKCEVEGNNEACPILTALESSHG